MHIFHEPKSTTAFGLLMFIGAMMVANPCRQVAVAHYLDITIKDGLETSGVRCPLSHAVCHHFETVHRIRLPLAWSLCWPSST